MVIGHADAGLEEPILRAELPLQAWMSELLALTPAVKHSSLEFNTVSRVFIALGRCDIPWCLNFSRALNLNSGFQKDIFSTAS